MTILTSFTRVDYAQNNGQNENSDHFEFYMNSIDNIDDAYILIDILTEEESHLKNDMFDIIALHYKATNLNYSSFKKQTFMDSIFSKTNIRYALIEQDIYGIPASVTLAQAYLESKKSGKYEFSKHVKHTNNLFGIKYASNKLSASKYNMITQEELTKDQIKWIKKKYEILKIRPTKNGKYRIHIVDAFAAYDSIHMSFRMHSLLLDKYNVTSDTYHGWTSMLVEKGYATGSGYSQLLNKIIQEYKLYELDHI